MKRLTAWASRNIDTVIALVVAAGIVGLDIFSDIPDGIKSSGILLVLSVLVVSTIRDRSRQDDTERQLRDELRRAGDIPPALAALEATIAEVGRILGDASMIRVLTWPEVAATLDEARRTTDRWVFRGGTGTYIRAKTLPDCVAHARRNRRGLLMRLEIIDPTNAEVCARYARFRRALGTDRDWTLERTQRESYATIVACCWHRQRYELLDVRIGLSQVMPTLRWDLSASSLLITQEDPRKPAMLVERGKLLYEYVYTELGKSLEQVRPVPLDDVRHVELSDEPTVDEVRKLLMGLNMPLPSSFTDSDVSDIVERALHAENWYDP
jgi:hypothetical protein